MSSLRSVSTTSSHHSLVTPIDWKLRLKVLFNCRTFNRHHSLVAPIDWKPCNEQELGTLANASVTTRW